MRITHKQLRNLIKEAVNQPDWNAWYDAFEAALVDAGYDSLYDTPVFDFVSSEDRENVPTVERALQQWADEQVSPEEAVHRLEQRDDFWNLYPYSNVQEE